MIDATIFEAPAEIKIKKVRENTQLPRKANETDAAYDCYAAEVEETEDYVSYKLGFALEIPDGWCAFVFPRSSNSKYDLILTNSVGVIDSGYRGELEARFKKTKENTDKIYQVNDRVCQILFYRLPNVYFSLVQELDGENDRGGGFGSTGK